jgi:hypothetical protein
MSDLRPTNDCDWVLWWQYVPMTTETSVAPCAEEGVSE